jgi:hypothetical protein
VATAKVKVINREGHTESQSIYGIGGKNGLYIYHNITDTLTLEELKTNQKYILGKFHVIKAVVSLTAFLGMALFTSPGSVILFSNYFPKFELIAQVMPLVITVLCSCVSLLLPDIPWSTRSSPSNVGNPTTTT